MDTDRLRIELTQEQQDQVKDAFGQVVRVVELKLESLEQRIAPTTGGYIELQSFQFGVSH